MSKPFNIEFSCQIGLKNSDTVAFKGKKGGLYSAVFLVYTSSNVLLHFSKLILRKLVDGENVRITHKVQKNEKVLFSLMSEDFGMYIQFN